MIIRRKHVCDKTDTPNNDWDVEIERERQETVEDNGNIVIDYRKRSMYFIKDNYYGNRKNN